MIYILNGSCFSKDFNKRKKHYIKSSLDPQKGEKSKLLKSDNPNTRESVIAKNKILASSLIPNNYEKPALHFSSKNVGRYTFINNSLGLQENSKKKSLSFVREDLVKDLGNSVFASDPLNFESKESRESRESVESVERKADISPQLGTRSKGAKKKYYTSYSKLSEVKLLTIGIASPLRILQWAEKTLPNGKIYGEVLNANTLHHKTFKPQKGGLFCERIFGPLKDFECACGKIDKSVKKMQTEYKLLSLPKKVEYSDKQNVLSSNLTIPSSPGPKGGNQEETGQQSINVRMSRKFCPNCDVEYTWSVIRRYQLGYIKLSSPVTHIWFLKGTPSYLSLLLDMKKRYLQFVTYCSETLTIEKSSLPFYSSTDSLLANFSQPSFLDAKKKQKEEVFADSSSLGLSHLKGSNSSLKMEDGVKKREGAAFAEKRNVLEPKSSLNSVKLPPCIPKKGWYLNKLAKNDVQNLTEGPSSFLDYKGVIKKTNLPFILASPFKSSSVFEQPYKQEESLNSTKKGAFVLSTLLLSINYKYLKNFQMAFVFASSEDQTKASLLPNLKTLFKKLPLDLYILCSLERMLHKSSINLSIQKTWEILYKKAFVKSINKAKYLFTKFVVLNLISPSLDLTSPRRGNLTPTEGEESSFPFGEKSSEGEVKSRKGKKNLQNKEHLSRVVSKSSLNSNLISQEIINYLRYRKKTSYALTLDSDRKVLYKGERDLNISNASLANTISRNQTVLKNLKNKYSSHVLKLLENLKYPILSLNYTTKFLQKNSFFQIQKLISLEMTNYFLKNTEYLEKVLSELLLNSLLLDQFTKIPENTLNFNITNNSTLELDLDLDLESKSRSKSMIILNTFKNYLKVKVKVNKRKKQSSIDVLNTVVPNSFITKGQGSVLNKTNNFKKKIYNNVYTLSHRERWDVDKDWYIFSLFTFGITEYTDYPVYTYKHRLLSLTNLQDYSYNSYFSQNLNTNTNTNKFDNTESSNRKLNTLGELGSTSSVSSSFIYSSSFYSGAGIVQQLLNEFDFNEIKKLDKQNRLLLYQLNKSILKLKKFVQIFVYDKNAQMKLKELCKKRDLLIRRTKLVRKMFRKNTNPASMILTVIPVLPPDLRPIVKMGSQIAASDLNRLYQRVIYRNDRLKKFLKDPATSQSYEMKYAQRLLQEAVDNLMQNGKSGPNSEKDARGRALKSLSDILKGKQGRFRQFLLGKRVDYSGRSVIVVGPKLKLHECGLPLEMAKELYLPFLLKSILNKNYAKTVVGAKTLIKNNPSLANELLREIMQVTPVLLNRAPTLHRLGIQAFVPKLIEGRAILLHPLVCSAFNADFDGDQMAVHVPITVEARAEAWKIMLSRNNLLSPATGEPLAIPSQDMVLGCYYLTTFSNKSQILRGSGMYFNHLYDVIKLYEQVLIDIHAFVWVKWTHLIENGSDQESPLEIRISSSGQWQEITSNYQKMYDSNHNLINLYMCTTPGRILFNLIIQKTIENLIY